MKIQEQDFYHGVALTQIVEHGSFTALNKASQRYGHYLVNADRRMFVKYRTNEGTDFQFSFSAAELAGLASDLALPNAHVFTALVCGGETVCLLDSEQIETVIDPTNNQSQWIRVWWPEGGGMRVVGSVGELSTVLPHNSFPSRLFT